MLGSNNLLHALSSKEQEMAFEVHPFQYSISTPKSVNPSVFFTLFGFSWRGNYEWPPLNVK
jgi:hypothetical protein